MNMSPQSVSIQAPSDPAAHSSLLAVIAVAIVAYATNDVIHELVGHGTVALLLGIKITSISSVGIQSLERSRLLSAAGSIANVLSGVISFLWLQRRKKFGRAGYLLWLFGLVNVMGGTCYLLARHCSTMVTGPSSLPISIRRGPGEQPWVWWAWGYILHSSVGLGP